MSQTPYSIVCWRKSTRSGSQSNCVEVGRSGDDVVVRDSKSSGGPWLCFSQHEWLAFLEAVDHRSDR